jgi:hypothetical protein
MRHPTFHRCAPVPRRLAAVVLTLAACGKPEPPKIAFAPYDKSHQSKMDLAQVDYKFPIAPAELAKITPDYLATLDQEQLDQIYARLPAGPIPMAPSTAASCCRAARAASSACRRSSAALPVPRCTSRGW